MKVLCIDAEGTALLVENGIYTVVGEKDFNIPCYYLAEIVNQAYDKSRFIPLSEIDETEEAKHRELKKIRESLEVGIK